MPIGARHAHQKSREPLNWGFAARLNESVAEKLKLSFDGVVELGLRVGVVPDGARESLKRQAGDLGLSDGTRTAGVGV